MSFLNRSFGQLLSNRIVGNNSILGNITNTFFSNGIAETGFGIGSAFGLQRRWKSRGNTYQPSTLKRKRRVGFLARARSKSGNKILERRKAKGRWYLTH